MIYPNSKKERQEKTRKKFILDFFFAYPFFCLFGILEFCQNAFKPTLSTTLLIFIIVHYYYKSFVVANAAVKTNSNNSDISSKKN